jgi:urea transport system permease protein
MTSSPLIRALDRGAVAFVLVLVAIGVLVPLLNLLLPPSSPWHVPTYLVALWGKYVCYALLALSIDLIWGYCGILSLGHGAFFALGGYAMGMYLMRQIGTRGVYADPILPGLHGVPELARTAGLLVRLQHFAYAALMVLLVPGALAFVFGWFAFRSRVTGVYLSIITQALTFALMLGFFRNNFGFGGNNGLTDFKDILGFNVQAQSTRAALFATSVAALILGFLICRTIVASKLGMVLVSIATARGAHALPRLSRRVYKAVRVHAVRLHGGVAGALYVPQVGIINPERIRTGQIRSKAVIWVAVGGRGTLIGRGARRRSSSTTARHVHLRRARALLAVRARQPVRAGYAAAAARHRRHLAAHVAEASRARQKASRTRTRGRAGRAETGGVSEWRTAPPPRCSISTPSRCRSTASAR